MSLTSKWIPVFSIGLLFILGCTHAQTRNPASDIPPSLSEDSDANPVIIPEIAKAYQGLFDWPVNSARLSQPFHGKNVGHYKRAHLGIDLAAPKGTPIYAAQDGVIIYVGRDFKGYGRMIMLEGKHGFASLYAHLSKASVRQGQQVKKGFLIGAMGRTGRATGVHLHFEIRKDRGPVDPLNFLPNGDQKRWHASLDEEPSEETAED